VAVFEMTSLAHSVQSVIPQFRKMFSNQQFLGHLEKAAERFEAWSENRTPGHLAAMRQMMGQMQKQFTGTAAATAQA
jgi:hypothetical protein